MKLIIISGRSGSGKSSALHALEDEGFYCVDNLPANMLDDLPNQLNNTLGKPPKMAVSIDVRNVPGALEHFPKLLKKLKDQGVNCQVLYLDADSDALMKRYSATRRKHPLSNDTISLIEAINLEKELLAPVAGEADIRLDSSLLSVHEIREQICQRFCGSASKSMTVMIQSFGFKHGMPIDADYVFDIRCLPNPFWVEALLPYTGLDQPVQEFLDQQPMFHDMLHDLSQFIEKWIPHFESAQRSYFTIAIGCTGGQHRSVYMSEKLAEWLSSRFDCVQIRHRELSRP